jgi:hypothetical protein
MKHLEHAHRPRQDPAVERLRGLATAYSTIRVDAIVERSGLSENSVLAAAQHLRLPIVPRAGVLWVLLNARKRDARDFKGDE